MSHGFVVKKLVIQALNPFFLRSRTNSRSVILCMLCCLEAETAYSFHVNLRYRSMLNHSSAMKLFTSTTSPWGLPNVMLIPKKPAVSRWESDNHCCRAALMGPAPANSLFPASIPFSNNYSRISLNVYFKRHN